MKDKYDGPDDYGGVHINSGIPNHAFYLAATAIGGRAWEKTGRIWYHALLTLSPRSAFTDAARATTEKAAVLFGPRSAESTAVRRAWKAVGVVPSVIGQKRS
jgi:Zn-dependent metalloprotease